MAESLTRDEEFVLAAALRYALPRYTYALGIVADEIIRAIPRMTPEQRESYLPEIDVKPVDDIAADEIQRLREALTGGTPTKKRRVTNRKWLAEILFKAEDDDLAVALDGAMGCPIFGGGCKKDCVKCWVNWLNAEREA